MIWNVLRLTIHNWREHRDSRLAAAIAYYMIFSLAPLLVIIVSVAGAIFGEAAARGELSQQIENFVGADAVPIVESMIEGAGRLKSGLFAWFVGAVALMVGATGVFMALRDALADIWNVEQGTGLKSLVEARFISFLVIIACGLVFVALLVACTGLSVAVRLTSAFHGFPRALDTINFLLSFALIAALFAVVYKMISQIKLRWSDVWIGAALASLLFTVGKFLFSIYLVKGRMGSAYGAASSLIVLLFWIYLSAQVFLFGAEFIRVYAAERTGSLLSRPGEGRTMK
jgi:membrane protein